MRISDWSSDVCSSDLAEPGGELPSRPELNGIGDDSSDRVCRDQAEPRDRGEPARGLALGMPGRELLVEHRNLATDTHDLTDQYLYSRACIGRKRNFVDTPLFG